MTPFEKQLELLTKLHPGTASLRNPDGSHTITVPEVKLPEGWNAKTTTVYFVAPVGYPNSKPDCFWASPDLKVAGAVNPPQNTGSTPLSNGPNPLLWFSWHTQRWSPNSDSLLSYFRVIGNRLDQVR